MSLGNSTGPSAFVIKTDYLCSAGDFSAFGWLYPTSNSAFARAVDNRFDTGFWIGQDSTNAALCCGIRQTISPFAVSSTTGLSLNNWAAFGVSRSSTTESIYVNNSKNTDTCSGTALGGNNVHIGSAATGSSTTNPWLGQLTRCAIWEAVLSDEEFTALYKGFSPMKIRPQSLKMYIPAYRASSSIFGSFGLNSISVPVWTASDNMPAILCGY